MGGGATLIFSYIHRLWLFFGVQNFEFQYFVCGWVGGGGGGGGEGGQKILWIFLVGHHNIGLYLIFRGLF